MLGAQYGRSTANGRSRHTEARVVTVRGKWSAFSRVRARPTAVVMQPTTLCNLDCAYCYLPHRAADRRMPVAVARAVADEVNAWDEPVDVIWHGGEPLAAG